VSNKQQSHHAAVILKLQILQVCVCVMHMTSSHVNSRKKSHPEQQRLRRLEMWLSHHMTEWVNTSFHSGYRKGTWGVLSSCDYLA